ncbi:redox-sensitive transcriptional activator SoxR [Sphingomonas paucimobilis]|uniref:Redox-sensitive transcriptional activator SoxR n=2 Tax=Sphingomonas paucimobilis TaxID=13689 RepID=A0A7T3ADS0_SPHPI|nr:redox-sensitive transcriptional activator SoxR [Sphingomonas sp. S17]MBQ1481376.1 redox-sensitive transcriptional activator SoxR [Sphingomonas sp.]MDG5972234.1 redox-sensitive transcriptional activator SoxR [Sphingomonas paucimobilis]RSU66647.1 redox-sensitive transcriptional activator SoxR [Sphingomonas sp. S-NIH.Pt1_0416]GAN12614.1 redox-sensitive transcriptional activator SoxR [Sphingomonas paucimobilis NBRC 13935]QBE93927.1 redox-sensitive transcriptional activator SoxR [Sphingomonas pa
MDGERQTELSVGEVARRAGVPVSTLHFYEAQGLIESRRTKGNQRRYVRSVLRLIAIIRVAQRAGVPLARIRARLDRLPRDRPVTTADWSMLSADWRAELDERIKLLSRLRDQMDSCIGCGCLSISECPLRNPEDIAGNYGAGARAFDLS